MQAESPITVACVQMEPKIGDKKANVAHSLDKIAEAAGKGARLIVLPELCNSGYVFASRHEACRKGRDGVRSMICPVLGSPCWGQNGHVKC